MRITTSNNAAKAGGCFGCLGLIAFGLFFAIMAGGFGYLFLYHGRNFDEYQCALSKVQASEVAKGHLGDPITQGNLVLLKHYSIEGVITQGDLSGAISGSKRDAWMDVQVYRSPGLSSLSVALDLDEPNTVPVVIYQGTYDCTP